MYCTPDLLYSLQPPMQWSIWKAEHSTVGNTTPAYTQGRPEEPAGRSTYRTDIRVWVQYGRHLRCTRATPCTRPAAPWCGHSQTTPANFGSIWLAGRPFCSSHRCTLALNPKP